MIYLEIILEYIKVLIWPIVVIIVLIIFKKQIKNLLLRIISGKFKAPNGAEISIELNKEKSDKSIPNPGEKIITTETIRNRFTVIQEISGINEDTINASYNLLLKQGIVTESQLDKLLSKENIRILSNLYIDILKRKNKNSPLDPLGVASYGPLLIQYKNKKAIINIIKESLLHSNEYKKQMIKSVFEIN